MERARSPELDGLRGAAITAVVVYHYFTPLLPGGLLTTLSQHLARSGVDLFFVLSGFLLAGILIENRYAPAYFRTFYGRRACRILPLYAVLLAAAGLVSATGLDRANPVLRETLPWWSYLTLTQNIVRATHAEYGSMFTAATWSLAVEEQFYVLLPLAIWLTPTRRLGVLALFLVAAAPLLRWWTAGLPLADAYTATYAFTYCRLDTLFAGMLAAWLVRERGGWLAGRWPAVMAGTCAGATAGVIWAEPGLPTFAALLYSFLAVGYAAALVHAVTRPDRWLGRLVRSRILRWAGVRAYGIYLFHIAVVHMLHWAAFGAPVLTGHGWQGIAASLVAVAVTCWLADGAWSKIERPCIEWSRRRWPHIAPAGARPLDVAVAG